MSRSARPKQVFFPVLSVYLQPSHRSTGTPARSRSRSYMQLRSVTKNGPARRCARCLVSASAHATLQLTCVRTTVHVAVKSADAFVPLLGRAALDGGWPCRRPPPSLSDGTSHVVPPSPPPTSHPRARPRHPPRPHRSSSDCGWGSLHSPSTERALCHRRCRASRAAQALLSQTESAPCSSSSSSSPSSSSGISASVPLDSGDM